MSVCCPVCFHNFSSSATAFLHSENRDYYHCDCCDVIFVPPEFHLNAEQEQAVYSQHQNNPQDAGYRQFLARAIAPIQSSFKQGDTALDYGSGPGPTLHLMLAELGLEVEHYDLYFHPDNEVLTRQYNLITCTEVMEHIATASEHWKLLFGLVKPDGKLSIMTKRHLGTEKFVSWHYKMDSTHIVFYSEQTIRWIAKQYGQDVTFYGADVAIFAQSSASK